VVALSASQFFQDKVSHDDVYNCACADNIFSDAVVPVIGEYIAIKPGYCGGKPHILGHRIKVQHVAIWHERLGMTRAEIVATYPSLSLPAIHAALAYYHGHRQEIDADIAADEQLVAALKAQAGPSKLQQKLAERHAQDDSLSPG
jgi:uncharacterized protein (DUF433 family)